MALHPYGELIATTSSDGVVRLWSITQLEPLSYFTPASGESSAELCCFHPRHPRFLLTAGRLLSHGRGSAATAAATSSSATTMGALHVWDIVTGKNHMYLMQQQEPSAAAAAVAVVSIAWDPSGHRLAAADSLGNVRIFDTSLLIKPQKVRLVATFSVVSGTSEESSSSILATIVTCMTWRYDGRILMVCRLDGGICQYEVDMEPESLSKTLPPVRVVCSGKTRVEGAIPSHIVFPQSYPTISVLFTVK
jgi:WD40 repeat protein